MIRDGKAGLEFAPRRITEIPRRSLFRSGRTAHRGGIALAGLLSILTALGRVVGRDLKQLGSITGNNFFLFAFLLTVYQRDSGAFFGIVFALLLMFPLSGDPLRKIPPDRLLLWPLSHRQMTALRLASVWFSPAAWIALAILIWAAKPVFALAFLLVALAFHTLGRLFSAVPAHLPHWNPSRLIPGFGGPLGGLIRKDLRELLMILDPYAALVLTISGTAYRIAARPVDPDALMMLSLLVVLALSTYALCLFGLDTDSSFTRYHLLPLRGWQILLSKDVAFLLVAILLTLPLDPLAGFAAGLMALAAGHKSSTETFVPQSRWRFTGNASIAMGLAQVFLMFSAGTLVARTSPLVLLPCAVIYLASLWWYGRTLERVET